MINDIHSDWEADIMFTTFHTRNTFHGSVQLLFLSALMRPAENYVSKVADRFLKSSLRIQPTTSFLHHNLCNFLDEAYRPQLLPKYRAQKCLHDTAIQDHHCLSPKRLRAQKDASRWSRRLARVTQLNTTCTPRCRPHRAFS